MFSEPIRPTPMNPILTLSLAPARLPVKMQEVRAAAPDALRKSLRPVDACAMPLVVSGFPGSKMRCAGGRTGVNRSPGAAAGGRVGFAGARAARSPAREASRPWLVPILVAPAGVGAYRPRRHPTLP